PMLPRSHTPTLFPYTTLFRSRAKLLDVDGIIGLNLFSSLVVTFDYPKNRFRFRGGSLPADAMPYTTEHGVPTIAIDVNGQKFNRSEEHTSELQSRGHLVCRLL